MFLRNRFLISAFFLALIAVIGVWLPAFYQLARVGVWVLLSATIIDFLLLLFAKIEGKRVISTHLDLGEMNFVKAEMKVKRGWIMACDIIDELPSSFQMPAESMKAKGSFDCEYTITPTTRGAYSLGNLYAFIRVIGLLERRVTIEKKGREVKVFPAFSRLREKDRQIRSQQIVSLGSHKLQSPSNQTEFRDIREYVVGDDIRTVNWMATARTAKVMVNNYEDERSQHVLNVIDCGRNMHRTFNNLTLQDYAINASLLLSYTALSVEGDCVGLSTYGPSGLRLLPAKSGEKQLHAIMNELYSLETQYGEGDMEELCLVLDRKVLRRSLLILYTDFATLESMERQLPFLKRISRRHTLVVVNFIDRDLENVSERVSGTDKDIIERSIASDLILQQNLIADNLKRHGIHCITTYPELLSYNVVGKYLELRKR